MNKPVGGFTVFLALAISFGLIWLGVSGVDVPRVGRVFFGACIALLAAVMAGGVILSLLRR